MRSMVEGHGQDVLDQKGRTILAVPLDPAAARRGPSPRFGEE